MPIAGLLLVAQVLCAVHAGRTGRPYYWIMLILFMPMVGMIAYFLIEIVPDLTRSRTARSAASGMVRVFNPERDYRDAWRRVQIAPTIESRANLAEQCLRCGRAEEAAALYRELLRCAEGRFVALEEYARQMVYAEELHASEVDKMLRTPGEVAAFRPVRQFA